MWILFLLCGYFFYDVETFLRCGNFSTMWRLFVRCADFRCKEVLTGFELFSRIGDYVRSRKFYPFGHRAMQLLID